MDEKAGRPATVDEYIAQQPEDVERIFQKIWAAVTQAVEKISFLNPIFTYSPLPV